MRRPSSRIFWSCGFRAATWERSAGGLRGRGVNYSGHTHLDLHQQLVRSWLKNRSFIDKHDRLADFSQDDCFLSRHGEGLSVVAKRRYFTSD